MNTIQKLYARAVTPPSVIGLILKFTADPFVGPTEQRGKKFSETFFLLSLWTDQNGLQVADSPTHVITAPCVLTVEILQAIAGALGAGQQIV